MGGRRWRVGRLEGGMRGMTDLLGLGQNVPLFLISCSILRSSKRVVEDVRMPVTDDETQGQSQT